MRSKMMFFAAIFCCAVAGPAAAEAFSLDRYACNTFLQDVAKPDSADKLIRSTMMIAWATGYASAHQAGPAKADTRALQLIGASLGDECRKAPDKLVVTAITEAIARLGK